MKRRVVITGCGIISAIGNSLDEIGGSLLASTSGVKLLPVNYSRSSSRRPAAIVAADMETSFGASELKILDRVSQFALVTAQAAIDTSRLSTNAIKPDRSGVYFGTGLGGASSIAAAYSDMLERKEPPTPLSILRSMANAPAGHLSIRFGLKGPTLTYSIACASASVAIGEAFHAIRAGRLLFALAGGAEAPLVPGVIKSWESMRVLATPDANHPSTTCRPFSRDRKGIVLGEGAAMFTLESLESARRRDAPILCELLGYGSSSDALHIANPSPDGQASAMNAALRDAKLIPSAIDYINAHGTATIVGDASETRAIKAVFGDYASRVAISSTKAAHGHLLGGSGALELAVCIAALRDEFIPATLHLNESDPQCDLDYVPNIPRPAADIQNIMSNSFAFGGSNAVLIAAKYRH